MKRICIYTKTTNNLAAFTVPELIVCIVIIGIISSIAYLSYGSWKQSITISQVKNDLTAVATTMENVRNFDDAYPSSIPSSFLASDGVVLTVRSASASAFCIDGTSTAVTGLSYHITQNGNVLDGYCS